MKEGTRTGGGSRGAAGGAKPRVTNQEVVPPAVVNLLREAVGQTGRRGGWANISAVRNAVAMADSSFTSETYGYAKFSGILKACGEFDFEVRDTGISTRKSVYVRIKDIDAAEIIHR
ncbi:OST-HTH/LOTUS domain-containing protein [Nocardia thailandica]